MIKTFEDMQNKEGELFLNLLTFVDSKDHKKFMRQLGKYVEINLKLEGMCNQ